MDRSKRKSKYRINEGQACFRLECRGVVTALPKGDLEGSLDMSVLYEETKLRREAMEEGMSPPYIPADPDELVRRRGVWLGVNGFMSVNAYQWGS